jgi:hypothetical protein
MGDDSLIPISDEQARQMDPMDALVLKLFATMATQPGIRMVAM